MSYGGRVDHQWRSPVGLEDVLEESMSDTSFEQQPPQHPIATMQGAFEESMQETLEDAEESSLARKDSVYRRRVLLERNEYQRTVAGKWKQKAGEKYHPLWKIVAQLSFGMHLLHQELAKSDDEVIKILQGHVDEVDGFLERTTEDFELAQHDINERIRYLQLPLEHGEVFDSMLMDRSFRTAMVDGNVKIEHIVERTSVALIDSLKDVKKGSDGSKELSRYLRRLEKTWHGRDEAITDVFQAMMGNTEGWAVAFKELQDKGKDLSKSLEHLRAVIAEIQRLVGIASRRDVPQLYTPTSSSRPMSPMGSRSPDETINIASGFGPHQVEPKAVVQEPEPEVQRSRNHTPPALHPNAILEEEDEHDYSPPTIKRAPETQLSRDPTDSKTTGGYLAGAAAVGATAGATAGLAALTAKSMQEDESDRLTPRPFGRSGYSPQPDIIEEEDEDEDSDDSDYTIDIVDATPITSAPVRAVAQGMDIRSEPAKIPIRTSSRRAVDSIPDYTPPKIEFESSIPKPTEGQLDQSRKEFILPPLDLESETPMPALTPLDYERMRANRPLPPFDLTVPEQYKEINDSKHEQPKESQIEIQMESSASDQPKVSPHPFHKKESPFSPTEQPRSHEESLTSGKPEQPPLIIPPQVRLPFVSQDSPVNGTPPPRAKVNVLPRKPVNKREPFVPDPDQFYQDSSRASDQFIPEPDQFYQSSKPNQTIQTNLLGNGSMQNYHSNSSADSTPTSYSVAPHVENKSPTSENVSPRQTIIPNNIQSIHDNNSTNVASAFHEDRSLQDVKEEDQQEQPQNSRKDVLLPAAGVGIVAAAAAAVATTAAVTSNDHAEDDTPILTKQPRQLPIDNLLVRLRHGNGLVTPTETNHTVPERRDSIDTYGHGQPLPKVIIDSQQAEADSSKPPVVKEERSERAPVLVVPIIQPSTVSEQRKLDPEAHSSKVEDKILPQHHSVASADDESINQPRQVVGQDSVAQGSQAVKLDEKTNASPPRRPAVLEPIVRRRASYSDNRMTQRFDMDGNGLLSPDSIAMNPKHYPHSARVPSSSPWTFFSKDDMDHSYRHRRAHSLFSPATPYDLEWLLRGTPSDIAVSPMRWSEIYGFKSGHSSVISPLGEPFGSRSATFSPTNKTKTIDSILATKKLEQAKPPMTQPLHRPNSLQIDLAIARGQLSQASDVKPIQPAWKESTARQQRPDRSAVRASSVYSKAPDFTSVSSSPPPDVPQIVRAETGYTSHYDDSAPSSAYTDATFGQISPAPAISSAKPSPLHIAPKDRIPSAPASPASPKEEPKFPLEFSDEKHTVVEVPQVSPSLRSLVSATITGPEPDFPYLAATYGGPEPDYYYPGEEALASPRNLSNHEQLDTSRTEPVRMESPRMETSQFEQQQQQSTAFYPPNPDQTPLAGGFSTAYSPPGSTKRREGPPAALNLKLFPSMDSLSRAATTPRSPRPQDLISESGRPMFLPQNQNPAMSNPNLLALPPLTQQPMVTMEPIAPAKPSRSPLKKIFKDALSPSLLAGKLKRDKGHKRGKSSAENSLAKEATVAHAQLVGGPGPMHYTNGSISTAASTRNGSIHDFADGRRPSGERILYGHPGSDGRPF